MAERRSFSKAPRKALSADERERLVSELLGEEFGESSIAISHSPAQKAIDPMDALDALDAREMPEDDDIEADGPDDLNALDDAAFDEALREISMADLAEDVTDEAPKIVPPFELSPEMVAPFEEAPENAAAPDPEPEVVTRPEPEPEAEAEVRKAEPLDAPELEPEHIVPSLPAAAKDASADAASQEKLRAVYEMAAVETRPETADKWDMLDVLPVDAPHLERNLIITATRNEPAHGAFDVLRTRLVQTLLEHNWKRVAITSPSRNCGKTFTSVNLAISLSRYEANRTILLDFDMRNPSVAGVIGDTRPGKMGDFLRGQTRAEDLLIKFDRNDLNIGPSLAIGTNDVIEPYASELAHDPSTGESLDRMMEEMSPDIVLFDMPPALAFDDVIAFRKHFDGVLMVVGGGETNPEDVREVMRRLGEETPLLGVVLNQAEGEDGSDYSYGY